ncbi:MAG: tetratricopeptide repeat protein [Xanthomonadales bacterium]|jgi:tetratricopeptide (TPR) repeat protein|nr:tetratricopeptide repeat protein [Xanthomonadales bacterium]
MEAWVQAHEAGRHAEALPLIVALVEAFPQEPALQFRHAQTLRELGRFAEALQVLDRLLALRPQAVPALLQRAELEGLLGDPDAAERSLRRAVAVDPRHAPARISLAGFLLDRGEHRLAGYELDQVFALEPASIAAAALRERLQLAEAATTARNLPAAAVPDSAAARPDQPVRLLIDELPVAAVSPVVIRKPLPELPAEALQALLDAHWAGLRQDEDRMAATASMTALLLAWEPMPTLLPDENAAGAHAAELAAQGYRALARLQPQVRLPFAAPVPIRIWLAADRRVLAVQARPALPKVSLLERCWLGLTRRWQAIEVLELCSRLAEDQDSAGLKALLLSNNLGGQQPFADIAPVYVQRFSQRARAKALDVLHRERIEIMRTELGGRCLPLEDLAAAEALLREIHARRRSGRQQQELLRDEELQRFLGKHYARMAGRVYRQLEALQQGVQDLLAAQVSRASEPA